jgi:hypothetical protein
VARPSRLSEVLPVGQWSDAAVALAWGRLQGLKAALAVDAVAAEQRRVEAARRADVRMYPTGEGMGALVAELPAPSAAACWSTVDQLAWMVKRAGVLAGGSLQVAVTDADGALLGIAGRAELARIARRGCPGHPAGRVDLDHVVPPPRAVPPTATTCAACAGGITGSGPTRPVGGSSSPAPACCG